VTAAVAVGALTATALGAVSLAGQAATAAAPAQASAPQPWSTVQQATALGFDADKGTRRQPRGPNPYLALLPDPRTADYAGWRAFLERGAARRAATRSQRFEIPDHALVVEEEPAGTWGGNDSTASAQPVPELGAGRPAGVQLEGSLTNQSVRAPWRSRSREDDGSIPKARGTGVGTVRKGFRARGRIGNGPHGRAGTGRGDFDVYEVHGIEGRTLSVGTRVRGLDSMLAVFDAEGEMVAFNDDRDFSLSSFLRYRVPETGSYYVFVTGYDNLPRNPFRSGSGDGAGSQGRYKVRITQSMVDRDVYAVQLEPGDVLGTSMSGGGSVVEILDPAGELVFGSGQDVSFIRPMESPLPGGGRAVGEHVADEAGTHYVAVGQGQGDYQVLVEAYRPGLEGTPPTQVISLDYDGSRVNTGVWGGWGASDLSPLRGFLGRWGLTSADYEPLVDRITATVEENIEADLAAPSGGNPAFDVDVRVSENDDDPFGDPHVSRVVIGGTIDESGVPTIGISESIDPGNFGGEDTALVLLDVLSGDVDEWGDASLNYYLRPESDRVRFVGTAIGNIVAHEAGHFTGNWHVDQYNDEPNLMDQGGNFPVMYGVGPDGIGGTADDEDVAFGEDTLNPFEGFTGTEDTLTRMSMTLTQ
jgi:hypothetical protein